MEAEAVKYCHVEETINQKALSYALNHSAL